MIKKAHPISAFDFTGNSKILFLPIIGPASWEKLLGIKVGNRQSPIDIVQANASFDQSLKSLAFSYPSFENGNLQNNGLTVLFSPGEEGNTSGIN